MQTPKQQAASQRRSLKAMQSKVRNMALAWDEVDQYFVSRLDSLNAEIEKLDDEMAEFITDGGNDDNK